MDQVRRGGRTCGNDKSFQKIFNVVDDLVFLEVTNAREKEKKVEVKKQRQKKVTFKVKK